MNKLTFIVTSVMLLILSYSAIAEQSEPSRMEQDVKSLQSMWAHIKYEVTDEAAQKLQMEDLEKQANFVSSRYPNAAEPKIWEAIIISTRAGIQGGLGALKLVKKSRNLLFEAEKIKSDALDGSVYTSLGSLYYQVPGWPIGFGNDKQARVYLERALTINPDGVDPNYFFGDFLFQEGEYKKSMEALDHAMKAPTRLNRPIADKGRRQEIQELLVKVKKKMGIKVK